METKGKGKSKKKSKGNSLFLLLFDVFSHKVINFKHFSLSLFLANMTSLHRVDQLCIFFYAQTIIIDGTTVNLQGEGETFRGKNRFLFFVLRRVNRILYSTPYVDVSTKVSIIIYEYKS